MSDVKKTSTPKATKKKLRAAPTHPSWVDMIKVGQAAFSFFNPLPFTIKAL
jgi:hypothetical protein